MDERRPLLGGNYDAEYTLASVRVVYESLVRRARHQLIYLALADLIVTAAMWIVVTHGFQGDWQSSQLVQSITGYTFQRSLLDVTCVGAARVIVLLVAYSMERLGTFLFILLTTVGTLAFIIVKMCFFDFTAKDNELAYLMFIVQMLFPILEGYLWVSRLGPLQRDNARLYSDGYRDTADPARVRHLATAQSITRPHESAMMYAHRRKEAPSTIGGPSQQQQYQHEQEQQLLLQQRLQGQRGQREQRGQRQRMLSRQFINSDEDDLVQAGDSPPFRTPPSETADGFLDDQDDGSVVAPSTQTSHEAFRLQTQDNNATHMVLLGQDVLSDVERYATHDRSPLGVSLWRTLRDENGVTVSVLGKNTKVPVYRCEGLVWSSPEMLFRFLHDEYEELCKHSTLWQSMKVQRTYDKYTDLMYIMFENKIASPPRDATVVRAWAHRDNKFTLAFSSVEDPLVPERRNFTRAYDVGSGFHLQRVHSESNVTKLTFVLHMDLKVTGLFAPSNLEKRIVARMCRIHDEIRTALESRAAGSSQGPHHTFA